MTFKMAFGGTGDIGIRTISRMAIEYRTAIARAIVVRTGIDDTDIATAGSAAA